MNLSPTNPRNDDFFPAQGWAELVEHTTMCLFAVVMTETQPSQQSIFPPAPMGLE